MKNSPYTEDELLKIASKFKKHLKEHFATISNACPDLNQEFIFRFKALFYELQAHPLEGEIDSTSQDFISHLDNLAYQVRSLFPIFRFYMQKAFPYDSNLWEPYGYCEIEKVVNDYALLRECLEGSVKIIEEKRPELRAANCPEPTLREIESLSKQIRDKHEEMLGFLESIDSKKKIYQNNMNELYTSMKMVHDIASKCFKDNPKLLGQLTFPPKQQIT